MKPKESPAFSLSVRIVAVIMTIGAGVFAFSELQSIRESLTKMRFESNCHDPKVDIEACGQFGIRQIRSASSADEMRAGRELLQQMCDDHQIVACRHIAYSGESWSLDFVTYRNWQDELATRCVEEGGMACLARAYNEGDEFPSDLFKTAEAYCATGDVDACAAAVSTQRTNKPLAATACTAGLEGACDPNFEGRFPCAAVSVEADAELNTEESAEVCKTGDAIACGNWGSELLTQKMRVWRAPPMDSALIDQSFGAACRGGENQDCIHGANAALDRQIGTLKDTALADKLLKIGCDRNDAQACSYRLTLQTMPLEEAREVAKRACYGTPIDVYNQACRTHAAIWMADNGYTPWIMDSVLNETVLRDTCSKYKDRYSCKLLVEYWDMDRRHVFWPTTFPNIVEAWSAASTACSQGDEWSCGQLIKISQRWPTGTTQSVAELADAVCAKLPDMCPHVQAALANPF